MAIARTPALPAKNARMGHAAVAALLIGLSLAGCAGNPSPQVASEQPVIDPNDPLGRWVPLIHEASQRYDVPERWIRAVMTRESGGRHTTGSGRVLVSRAGAIGLMQVMPGTYELMRVQYGLGPDPTDPHDNVMAGTAYLREMYDLFGAPGFLAAYNCGPGCYANVLARKQKLPGETKAYLAALTPAIRGSEPKNGSASAGATAIEVAVLPKAPEQPAAQSAPQPAPQPAPVVVAEVPVPPPAAPQPAPVQVAELPPPPTPAPAAAPPAEPVRLAAPQPQPLPEAKAPAAPPAPTQLARIEAKPANGARSAGPAPATRMEVAQAFLPPGIDPDRVQIRFISQRSDGCGSLKGKESVCVSLERF